MPTYEITAPDGRKFRVTAPEGASQDDVLAYAQKQMGKPEESAVSSTRKFLSGASEAARQGLTLGLSDEIQAAMDAGIQGGENLVRSGLRGLGADVSPGMPMGEKYDQSLARQRGEMKEFDEAHPIISMGANIVGGLAVPGGALAKGAAKTAGPATSMLAQAAESPVIQRGLEIAGRYASKVPAALRPIAAGGAGGAVTGFNAGEGGFDERAANAVQGGMIGGAFGALAPLAVKGVSGIMGAVDEIVPANVKETAVRKIEKALGRDKLTPADLAAKLEASPELIPAAAGGRNLKALADVVVTRPGESGQRADKIAEALADQASIKASDDLRKGLGTSGEFYDTIASLDTAKRAAAAPLYEKAYSAQGNVWSDDLKKLADRPSVKAAMSKAYRIAAEEDVNPTALGLDLNEAGDVVLSKVPSMRTLDYIKRGLDDVVEGYRDPTSGRLNLNTEGRAVNDTLRQWVKALDDANPDYKAARDAWAGPTRAQAAMRDGEDFLTMRPQEIAEKLKDLGASERDYYRLGVERRILDVIENTRDGADVFKRLIGNERKRSQLKALFPSTDDFDAFIKAANDRIDTYNTLSKIRGGSPTAPRQAAQEDFAGGTGLIGDAMVQGALGERVGAAKTLARGLAARVRAPREDVANEVGSMLLPTTDDERAAFIQRLLSGPPQRPTGVLPQGIRPMLDSERTRILSGAFAGQLAGLQ